MGAAAFLGPCQPSLPAWLLSVLLHHLQSFSMPASDAGELPAAPHLAADRPTSPLNQTRPASPPQASVACPRIFHQSQAGLRLLPAPEVWGPGRVCPGRVAPEGLGEGGLNVRSPGVSSSPLPKGCAQPSGSLKQRAVSRAWPSSRCPLRSQWRTHPGAELAQKPHHVAGGDPGSQPSFVGRNKPVSEIGHPLYPRRGLARSPRCALGSCRRNADGLGMRGLRWAAWLQGGAWEPTLATWPHLCHSVRRGCGGRAVFLRVFSREGRRGGWGGALVSWHGGSRPPVGSQAPWTGEWEVTVASVALAGSPQTGGLNTRLRRTPPVWCQGPEPPASCDAGGQSRAFSGVELGIALQGPRSRVLQPQQEG